MPVSSVTEHWIKQDAIIINLNHFGDPDYLQVSVLAGAVVMAFKQDVIGYNAARNYRTWPLQAANTFLETTDALNVYARLTRSEVNASALIIYDPVLRDIEGRSISYADDGSEILGEADAEYYYIYLGQISSSIDTDGNEVDRHWSVDFRFGNLDTAEQNNFSGLLLEKMFKPYFEDPNNPDKLTSIEALAGLWTEQFLSAKGMNSGGSGDEPTGGATTLGGLRNVVADADRTYDVAKMLVLEANSNLWTLKNLSELVGGLDEAELAEYLTNNNYAKKGDIPSLEGYATEQWVLGKGYATTSDLDTRIDALVNGAPAAYDTLKEIADVLAGNVNSISDILTALGNKADKATTLSGYGITDAYTITQIDGIVNGLSGNISTLQGYFTDGVANSALKLSDNGSYTAWGQTFFTNGKPKSLNGSIIGGNFLIEDRANNPYIRLNQGAEYTGYLQILEDGGVAVGSTSTKSLIVSQDGDVYIHKLHIGNGTIEWDEANKGFKVTGLYSTTYLSAKGANTNGGSTPSGNQYTRLDTWDGYTSAMDGWVLSAKLGKGLYDTQNSLISRVGALEGKATNVSFTQSLTSGTQIGSISIDGVAKNIYAPTIPTDDINKGVTAYGWSDHSKAGYLTSASSLAWGKITGTPTTLSGYGITDAYTKTQVDSALGGYVTLSTNQTITGIKTYSNTIEIIKGNSITDENGNGVLGLLPTNWDGVPSSSAIALGTLISSLYFRSIGDDMYHYRFDKGAAYKVLDSSNYSEYALPLSGGTMNAKSYIAWSSTEGAEDYSAYADGLKLIGYNASTNNYRGGIHIGTRYGWQIVREASAEQLQTRWRNVSEGNWGDWKTIAFTDSNVASATKLSDNSAYTAWGQIFFDVGKPISISGVLSEVTQLTFDSAKSYGLFRGNYYTSALSANDLVVYNPIISLQGNVGIGTYNPQYKLDVNGSFRCDAIATGGSSNVALLNISRVYASTDYIHLFVTGGTNNARPLVLQNGYGNVGIGTDNPQHKLEVNGTFGVCGTAYCTLPSASADAFYYSERTDLGKTIGFGIGTSNNRGIYDNKLGWIFKVDTSDAISIGGGYAVSFGGNVNCNAVVYGKVGVYSDGYVSAKGQNTSSDMRLKNVLNEVVLGVKDIANAPSVRFSWKNGGGVDVGSSAQYWQGLLPDAVKEQNSLLEMQYGNIALLSAIAIAKKVETHEERIARVETHEERIARLEKENRELRNEINGLKYGK